MSDVPMPDHTHSEDSEPENTYPENPHSQNIQNSGPHPSRPNRRWLASLGLAGLLLAIGIPLVQSRLGAQETELSESNILAVETLTVNAVDSYEVARAYTGEIAALRSSDLGFTRSGELAQVLVGEGAQVSAGQALAQLDTQSLLTQRRQAEAQLAQARAQLLELERGARQEVIAGAEAQVRDLENQLLLQQQQRARRESLFEEGAISREQLDEFTFGSQALQARLDQAQSGLDELLNGTRPEQVAAQQAVVQQLEANIASLEVDLRKSTLLAPFDGRISSRQVNEGVVVGAGQSVMRLVEDEAPEARVGIPPAAARRLQVGETVAVNAGLETYAATVKAILPEVDPATRTQMVIFQLDTASPLSSGQTVRVELTETVPTPGLWLPTEALTQDIRGLWSTYVLTPGEETFQVQPKAVEIVHQDNERVLVQGTLQAGDRIVASGVHRLVPGQRVRPLD